MKTKFGILGCGGIAGRFAAALKLSENGELYAAAARDEARARAFIERHGGAKAYGSYRELVEDENVEIVYISNRWASAEAAPPRRRPDLKTGGRPLKRLPRAAA